MTATTLRSLREAKGMTQQELADVSGVHRISLIRIESGESKDPRMPTLRKLARALEVSTSVLLGEDDTAKPRRIQRRKGAARKRSADSARRRSAR